MTLHRSVHNLVIVCARTGKGQIESQLATIEKTVSPSPDRPWSHCLRLGHFCLRRHHDCTHSMSERAEWIDYVGRWEKYSLSLTDCGCSCWCFLPRTRANCLCFILLLLYLLLRAPRLKISQAKMVKTCRQRMDIWQRQTGGQRHGHWDTVYTNRIKEQANSNTNWLTVNYGLDRLSVCVLMCRLLYKE